MKFGVIVFPGSNCDHDIYSVLKDTFKQETVKLWHKSTDLEGCDFIIVPGGFSYGDYLRSGAIARFSPIMSEVIKHAESGGYVLGICNGFQILTEAHLLDGALLRNDNQKFNCKNVFLQATSQNSLITQNTDKAKAYKIPIAHAEGRYYASDKDLNNLIMNDQILFRYCDADARVTDESCPNGSAMNIAAICNKGKKCFWYDATSRTCC